MWFVYVIKSTEHPFIYIGSTNNIERRLSEHNNKLVLSTKHYAPLELLSYIAVSSEKQARNLGQYFKTRPGKAILYKRIMNFNPSSHEAIAKD